MNKFPSKSWNPSLSRWQIWFAYVRYDECGGGKNRPVLVTNIKGSECTVMEISSRPATYESDIRINDLTYTELNKESVIQTRKIKTVSKESLKRYAGALSPDDIRRVRNIVGAYR